MAKLFLHRTQWLEHAAGNSLPISKSFQIERIRDFCKPGKNRNVGSIVTQRKIVYFDLKKSPRE